jgi:hypothetical protein
MTTRRRRLYDKAQWRRLREQALRMEPLCRLCVQRGLAVEAVDVDHITPLADVGKHGHPLTCVLSAMRVTQESPVQPRQDVMWCLVLIQRPAIQSASTGGTAPRRPRSYARL